MKWIYGFMVVLSFSMFTCENREDMTDCFPSLCKYRATVKDRTGLDGCGFVLELADGSRLVPQRLIYIQPPKESEDPAYYFNFVNGQKVYYDYRKTEGVDACMAGKLVFITCIKAASSAGDQ